MGEVKVPDLVNLVMFIFAPNVDYWIGELKSVLEEHFGSMDYISPALDFEKYTYYYSEEMGYGIKGKLLSFERLIHPSQLPDIKLTTNEIEEFYKVEGNRRVNIDPGYIHHTQFVLASTKAWGNRIYLSKGIYAEITLMYYRGKFVHFDFTYPNYREEEYKRELEKIRSLYIKKRKRILRLREGLK